MSIEDEINKIIGGATILEELNRLFGVQVTVDELRALTPQLRVILSDNDFIPTFVANVIEATMPLSDESYGHGLVVVFIAGVVCGYFLKRKEG